MKSKTEFNRYLFIIVASLLLCAGCEKWMNNLFSYGDTVTPQYHGTAAELDNEGGWLIDLDESSKTYGCSIGVDPGTVRKQIFKISIASEVPVWEGTVNPDFEPRWIKFEPMNHSFKDSISMGLCFQHLPHENYYIMQIV